MLTGCAGCGLVQVLLLLNIALGGVVMPLMAGHLMKVKLSVVRIEIHK